MRPILDERGRDERAWGPADYWALGQALAAIVIIPPLIALATCSLARGDGLPVPPPAPLLPGFVEPAPVWSPYGPIEYGGHRGLVMTPQGLTGSTYVLSRGGLPPIARGPGGRRYYVPPPPPVAAPLVPGRPPAPQIVPNVFFNPFVFGGWCC